MLVYILFVIVGAISLKYFLSQPDPSPIYDVYSQPGKLYSLKWWAFRIILKIRERQSKRQKASGGDAGYGKKSRNSVEEMDKVQELSTEHKLAVDAVYFNGANEEGYYLVGATARRHHGLTQTLLYIRVPGVGLFELPSLPDTSLYSKEEAYSAGGLNLIPDQPMKTWKLTFSGKMRMIKPDKKEEEVEVNFDLHWEASTRCFDFDTDLDKDAICDAMAREKWSRAFFDKLKLAHQTHYEQFGELAGILHLGKYGDREIKLQGVRDHSYGNIRDWRDLHRYGIQYLHLKDGTSICVGNICMSAGLTRLIIGYVMHPDGRMDTVSWSDFHLDKMAEDGEDPIDFHIQFIAGEKNYSLKGHVLDRPIFYMGYQWEARIHERMCTFTVNGVPGWGISEWDYRSHSGRPAKFHKEGEPLS